MGREYSRDMAQIALGHRKAELVLKNAKVVQVFTNEIISADIAIEQGIIVGIGNYQGKEEFDLKGQYVCPGFIDAHLHLESTLVRPGELIRQAGLSGTTTFIVDPHEAANVAGTAGIDFILQETEDVSANVYVMLPSCVPSGPDEDNGYSLTAADMRPYLNHPRVLGLGEVMDSGAVLNGQEDMLEKLELFRGKIMDGHAGYLGEKETGCYALAGMRTDHECCTYEDALREMRAGMQILIREGTAAKNLEAILTGVIQNNIPCHQLAFCTDDKHIEDIRKQGHINHHVRKAIGLGLPPIEAYKIAAFYPAVCYGLTQLGAVAPGYQADLLICSDLENVKIEQVYHKGKLLSDHTEHQNVAYILEKLSHDKRAEEFAEKMLRNGISAELPEAPFSKGRKRAIPPELLHTVHIRRDKDGELYLPLQEEYTPVIELVPGEILTRRIHEKVKVIDGLFEADETFQKIAVLERHHATGKRGIGIVKGFFLRHGAIASTVCHDSHNLIVTGDNDQDMYRAIEALIKCGGGYAVVESGKEPLVLPLEIMGLLSCQNHEEVSKKAGQMLAKAHELGVPSDIDPFITLSFLSLPVIPQIRLTTRGLCYC